MRPILEYASPVWGGIPKYLETEIERVQQKSVRILGLEKDTLPTLKERREKATCNELKRIVEVPNNRCNRVRLKRGSGYGTERMRNGTEWIWRNGTERIWRNGTERNGYGVKMRNGTDMGLKRNLKFRP
jgi:hypothetical protein